MDARELWPRNESVRVVVEGPMMSGPWDAQVGDAAPLTVDDVRAAIQRLRDA